MITRTKSGWAVKSSSGRKFLSRRDLSKEEALKRLRQVEHFKHVSTNEVFTSNAQPQRTDPSKTGDIRRAFVRESNARFRDFKKALIEFLVKQDELALKPSSFVIHGGPGSGNFGHAGRPGERGGSASSTWSGPTKAGGSHSIKIEGGTKEDHETLHKALGYLDENQYKLVKTIAVSDLGVRTAARSMGSRVAIDTRTVKEHPAYSASVLAHEIEHTRMTLEKVPSSKQEDKARMRGAMFAGRKAAKELHGSPGHKAFNRAMKEQMPDWPTVSGIKQAPAEPIIVSHARRYEFQTSAQKLEAFSTWLDDQMDSKILSKGKGIWAGRYIDSAYKRGIVRAYTDVHGADLSKMQKGAAGATKAEFLRASMAVPERIDSVQLLATRTFEGMKGLTSRAKTKMNFILANGLANGEGPAAMAREMVDAIDIEQGRAETIARTETAHAQAEGQLSGYEELGVEEVGLQVEFLTAGDDRVCEKCQELADDGPYTIEQARGLIPVHPNCRCSWAPITLSPSERKGR